MARLSTNYPVLKDAPPLSKLYSNTIVFSKSLTSAQVENSGSVEVQAISFDPPNSRLLTLFQSEDQNTPMYHYVLTNESSGEIILPPAQNFSYQTIRFYVVSSDQFSPWFVRPNSFPETLDGENYVGGRSAIYLQAGAVYEFLSIPNKGWVSRILSSLNRIPFTLDSAKDTVSTPLNIEMYHTNKVFINSATELLDTFIKLTNNTFPAGASFKLHSVSQNPASIKLDVTQILSNSYRINGDVPQNNYMLFERAKSATVTRISNEDWTVEGDCIWSAT